MFEIRQQIKVKLISQPCELQAVSRASSTLVEFVVEVYLQ